MTAEERFERIEHATARLVEQAKIDREENRILWRETNRQLQELGAKVDALASKTDSLADVTAANAAASFAADERLGARIDEVDRRLGERIGTLVSAIGQFIAAQGNRGA